MRVLATIALLVLALAVGCGDDDDYDLAQPAPTTETAPPPPAPAQPEVPRAERAAAIAVVSRYTDALQAGKFARACTVVAASGDCEATLERFAGESKVLGLTRTVPVWDSGAIESGTGVVRARVKIGFPARPEIPWTFRLVKEPGQRWRLVAAAPSETDSG